MMYGETGLEERFENVAPPQAPLGELRRIPIPLDRLIDIE